MVALLTEGTMLPPIVTVEVAVVVQPATEVAVIVYTVVAVGLAVTEAPVVLLRPVPGLQVYVLAPVAVKVAELPGHMVIEFTETVGVGLTVTVDVAVAVQPATDVAVIV